jgi:hypothetical protein
MSRVVRLPYATRDEALSLVVDVPGVDRFLAGEGDTVDLRDRFLAGEDPGPFSLRVAFSEAEVIPAVTPEGDDGWAVGVLFHSIPSRTRQLIPLTREAEDLFVGDWHFEGDEAFREGKLAPVLYRYTQREPDEQDGMARHRGAILAEGEGIRLLFDYFPAPGNHWLRMTWDTLESGKLFRVETEEDSPLVLLNDDPGLGLEALLRGGDRLPDHLKELGKTIGSAIMAQATLELSTQTLFAITEAHAASPDQTDEEICESLREWQLDVANYWAAEFSEAGADDPLLEYIREARDLTKLPEMLRKVFLAVQTTSELAERVSDAKREIDAIEEDDQ